MILVEELLNSDVIKSENMTVIEKKSWAQHLETLCSGDGEAEAEKDSEKNLFLEVHLKHQWSLMKTLLKRIIWKASVANFVILVLKAKMS
ncbi:UNVERIFIED_CONTAM: hypothetical protein RMT77_015293 [Armadillidium vulgare]